MDIQLLLMVFSIISALVQGTSQLFCDQAYQGRLGSGVITSHNFPFDYRHNLNCKHSIILNIAAEETKIVCLTFYRFQLETSTPFCSFDSLKLDYVNLKYCGVGLWQYAETSSPNANVWSRNFCFTVKETRSFDITFSTDNNINAPGFYATFTVHDGTVDHTSLAPSPGQAPCSGGQWTCFNRQCISQSLLCDGHDDCRDGSDESYAHARCGGENVQACDFSSDGTSDGYCEFTHEGWYRTKERNSPYGPEGDHTNGTEGHYVYTDVNQGSAYLLSPELTLTPNHTHCLTFWYYIYGSPADTELHVYISRDQAYSRPEWTLSYASENEWVRGQVLVQTNPVLQVIFEAELGNSFSGVALDDISFMPGFCNGNDVSCNFESSLCGWVPKSSIGHHHGVLHGNLTWRLHNRLLGPVGPFWDRSSKDGGGYYLYLNTSSSPASQRALIISPTISSFPGKQFCFHFWYHMAGLNPDCCQLRVKVQGSDGVMTRAVWSQHGDLRNEWNQASVPLQYDNPFQLILEGTVVSSSRGEIGIDEITIETGSCSSHSRSTCQEGEYLCSDGACINASLKCNGLLDCDDGSDEGELASCATYTVSAAATAVTATAAPSCLYGQFLCSGDECIPRQLVCDGVPHCSDGSDEREQAGCTGLTSTTTPICLGDTHFLCANGVCISADKRCNGANDCGDFSDEGAPGGCSSSTVSSATQSMLICGTNEFRCLDNSACIILAAKCDGVMNCADGSDEDADANAAGCSVPVKTSSGGLSTGAIVGIAVGASLCIVIIILSALLGRRRRKPRPRQHRSHMQRGSAGAISTISTNTASETVTSANTLDRHMNMLASIREPMHMVIQPPPYTENNHQSNGYPAETHVSRISQSEGGLPPEEPPPPYDAVLKEHSQQVAQQRLTGAGDGAGPSAHGVIDYNDSTVSQLTPSHSHESLAGVRTHHSRNNSIDSVGSMPGARTPSVLSSQPPATPLVTSTPTTHSDTLNSARSTSTGSEHIYEEPFTLPRSGTTGFTPPLIASPSAEGPQLPERPPLMPLTMYNQRPQPGPQRIKLGTTSLQTRGRQQWPAQQQLPGTLSSPAVRDTSAPYPSRSQLGGYERLNPPNPPPPPAQYDKAMPVGDRPYSLENTGAYNEHCLTQPSQHRDRPSRRDQGSSRRRSRSGSGRYLKRDQHADDSPQSLQSFGRSSYRDSGRSRGQSHPRCHQSRRGSQPPASQNSHSPFRHQPELPYFTAARPHNQNLARERLISPVGTLSSSPVQYIPGHATAPQDHIFLTPISSSSTDPYHPRMDSTESFGGCSTSPLMVNSSHDDSGDLDMLSPTSV